MDSDPNSELSRFKLDSKLERGKYALKREDHGIIYRHLTRDCTKHEHEFNYCKAAYKEVMTLAKNEGVLAEADAILGDLDGLANPFHSLPPPGKRIEFSVAKAIVPGISPDKMQRIMMDENHLWFKSMFPIITRRNSGVHWYFDHLRTRDPSIWHVLQVRAAMQLPSASAPTRYFEFLRYRKMIEPLLYIIVDFPIGEFALHLSCALRNSKRNPSGVIIRFRADTGEPEGCEIIWIENMEVDETGENNMYSSIINSNLAFGAQRCINTLLHNLKRDKSKFADSIIPVASTAGSFLLDYTEAMKRFFMDCVCRHPYVQNLTVKSSAEDPIRILHNKTRKEDMTFVGVASFRVQAKPLSVFQFLMKKDIDLEARYYTPADSESETDEEAHERPEQIDEEAHEGLEQTGEVPEKTDEVYEESKQIDGEIHEKPEQTDEEVQKTDKEVHERLEQIDEISEHANEVHEESEQTDEEVHDEPEQTDEKVYERPEQIDEVDEGPEQTYEIHEEFEQTDGKDDKVPEQIDEEVKKTDKEVHEGIEQIDEVREGPDQIDGKVHEEPEQTDEVYERPDQTDDEVEKVDKEFDEGLEQIDEVHERPEQTDEFHEGFDHIDGEVHESELTYGKVHEEPEQTDEVYVGPEQIDEVHERPDQIDEEIKNTDEEVDEGLEQIDEVHEEPEQIDEFHEGLDQIYGEFHEESEHTDEKVHEEPEKIDENHEKPKLVVTFGTNDKSNIISLHRMKLNELANAYILQEASMDEDCSFIISKILTQQMVDRHIISGMKSKDSLQAIKKDSMTPIGFAIMPDGRGGLDCDACLVTFLTQLYYEPNSDDYSVELVRRDFVTELNDVIQGLNENVVVEQGKMTEYF